LGVTDCNSIQIKQAYKKSYCTACAEKLTSAGQ